MAPRSRRGGGKAAAAAAARRQWKVGDLVLAKVKGFPPWPATVSEPEKWGFTTDWKKVFVYFYGTKQIAFCNPADVEAFTEEKRKSLLGKLHGRGADFVRAVEEIIDCFEKSKQDGGNEGVEGTASNAGTCEVSVVKYSEKVETNSSIPDPLIGRLYEPVDRNGLNVPVDVPVAATEIIAPHDLGTVIEDAVENTMIPDHPKETKLATSNSRKRSREKPVQNSTIHKKAPSFRKSRSSKKVDSSKFENLIMAVNDLSNKNGAVSDAINGEPIRRNRRTRETLDNSVCHDMLSPVSSAPCVSNGSSEGNASDTVATDSDAVSMNEASTLDSTCETEHPGISVDYLKRDVQVSETLLACAKTVVKKKRKPNRKRVAPCPAGVATSSKIELGEVGKNKAIPSSPAAVEKFTERGFKADGDEHLPLVKRARVRMGKLSTEENGTDNLLETKKRSSEETSVDHSKLVPVLAGCSNNYPPYKVSLEEAREAGNGPQVPMDTAQFTGNESVLWNTKKFQLRGCSADGEAALPPSKRLHRALEAMSANAAEDDKINSANQRATMNVTSNGCSSLHQKCSHNIAGSELEMQEKKSCDDHNMASCETPDVTSSEAKFWESTVGTSISPKLRESKVSITEAQNYVCTRDLDVSSLNTQSGGTEVQLQSSQPSTSFEEKHDSRSPERLPPSAPSTMEEQKLDSLRPSEQSPDNMSKGGDMNNLGDKSDGENSANGSESISEAKDIQCVSSPHDVENSNLCEDILCVSPPHNAENSNPSEETKYKSSPAELTKIDGMCEVVKDVQVEIAEKDIGVPYHDTSLKGLIAAAQAKRHLSHATSLSENFMDDKVAPDASHSPSITRMIGNSQKVSPRHLSLIAAAQAKRHLSRATSLSENFMDDKVVSDTSQSPSITRIIDNSQKVSPRHFSLIAAAQAKRHLSHATSLSVNSMDDKVVSDTSHSPSITRMIDNSQKVSPCHLSLRSTSFNSSYLQRNGSGSPDILPNFKKTAHVPEMDKNGHLEPTVSHRQKLLSKWPSAEVSAALKSFEVLLGTLSRTKDSIGRATNLAIDCAKYGIAGEVWFF